MGTLLADAILVLHLAFVLFVIGGLLAVWIGAWRGWAWVRNFWFRLTHLAAILFVAGEALFGMVCPLTAWEDALRGRPAGESGFVADLLHRMLFYSFPEWVFTTAYVAFALIVTLTYRLLPPQRG